MISGGSSSMLTRSMMPRPTTTTTSRGVTLLGAGFHCCRQHASSAGRQPLRYRSILCRSDDGKGRSSSTLGRRTNAINGARFNPHRSIVHQQQRFSSLSVPRTSKNAIVVTRACRPRRCCLEMNKRLSTNEAGTSSAVAAEPSSEETAQQLSQLLEQPLALESFITKELTTSQRQAIQRLLHNTSDSNAKVDVPEPSVKSLRLVAFNTSIPFVGFGIMDNMM